MARRMPPLAHKLPWWDIRAIDTTYGSDDYILNVDGTMSLGFVVDGVDLFSFDDSRLNEIAASVNRALNLLPEDGFLQADWRVGLDFEDVIGDFERRGAAANPVLQEQRRRRVSMLRHDSLIRGRLVYYVGQRHAFGRFSPAAHRAREGGVVRRALHALGLAGADGDPYGIKAQTIVEAATALREVAGSIAAQFKSVGVTLVPLDADGLLGEMHQALNPVSAMSTPLPSIMRQRERLTPAELEQTPYAFVRPRSVREQMPLGDLTWTDTTFSLDDPPLLHRALTLQHFEGASSCVDSLWSAQFATSLPYRLVTTWRATDRTKMTAEFVAKQKRMNAVAMDGHVRNIQAEISMGEAEDLIELVNSTDQRLFQGSMTAILAAPDETTLDKATESLKRTFRDSAGKPVFTSETGRQLQAFVGALPGNGYTSPRHQPFVTSNAADFTPIFVPSVGDRDAQLVYHTRTGGLRKVSFHPSKINRNMVCFGVSGSGKSFNLSSMLEQLAIAEGHPLIVVDVQGYEKSNYRLMAELFGGGYTALYGNNDLAFNPFPPCESILIHGVDAAGRPSRKPDHKLLEKLQSIVCIMAVPEFDTRKHALHFEVARVCLLKAYDAARANKAVAPIISDVVRALASYEPPADRREYADIARGMLLQLETWTRPSVRARLLNRQTTFSTLAKFQVFDFFGMDADPQLATVLLMCVSDLIWHTVVTKPPGEVVYVVFDETWKMLRHPVASALVEELYKTVRKSGGAAWAVTQSAKDILLSPVAAGLLDNAEYVFSHRVGDPDAVAGFCEMNERQRALLRGLEFVPGEYSEILLFERSTKTASVLRYRADSFEAWVNTTNSAEIERRNALKAQNNWSMAETIRALADESDRQKAKKRK